MAYRLPGGRVPLDLDGPSVEVERILSAPIQQIGVAKLTAYEKAKAGDLVALRDVYEYAVAEAQPTWDIVDHRGPVPVSAGGMLRLPVSLALSIVVQWLATFEIEEQPTSAVDALVPPGELNTELKKRLATAKRRNRKAA